MYLLSIIRLLRIYWMLYVLKNFHEVIGKKKRISISLHIFEIFVSCISLLTLLTLF